MQRSLAAAASAAIAASASATLIVDTSLNDADWCVHQSPYDTAGSSSSSEQAAGARDTGNARRTTNLIAPMLSGIHDINVLATAGWNGSNHLEGLSFSIRARQASGPEAFGFVVEQSGSHWIAGHLLNTPSYALDELPPNLTASDFIRPFGVDPSSRPEHPDFSTGASPIRFGFSVANSSSAAAAPTARAGSTATSR